MPSSIASFRQWIVIRAVSPAAVLLLNPYPASMHLGGEPTTSKNRNRADNWEDIPRRTKVEKLGALHSHSIKDVLRANP